MKSLLEQIEAAGALSEPGCGGIDQNKFDHPCRQTCSGWMQGFERGEQHQHGQAQWQRDALKIAVEMLNKIDCQCGLSEWDNPCYRCEAINEIAALVPGGEL